MAQHDYVIANGTGAAVRSDLNGSLAAIVSQNSGATAPSTTYAYMTWADTTAGVMKMRNGANNAWITLYQLDGEWTSIAFENGTAAAPSIYFKDSGTDTGFYSPGTDQVGISTGGVVRLTTSTTAFTGTLPWLGQNGTAAAPALSFSGDPNTGVYNVGADNIGVSTNGTLRFDISTTAVTSTLPVVYPLGAVGTPSLTFTGDLNTGIYSPGADQVAITTAGVQRVNFNAATEVVFNDGGADVDFRIEGDTNASLFKIDAGLDQVQVANLNGGQLAGTRNRVINGAVAVDQRNGGAAQTFTAAAALAYNVDRWYGYCTGANVTGQRVTGATAGEYRYRFTGAASVTAIGFGHRIEQLNSTDLASSTATLSVDLANSLLTTVTWTAYYATTADTFGTLASPTRTQIATGTFTVTSTVTRYNTNISVPAAATTGIEIVFTVGAQTSGTWTIGNVQLEPGTVATPFERRSYGQELALCQRYYFGPNVNYSVQSYGTTGANAFTQVWFPVTMRAAPTISASFSGLVSASGGSFAALGVYGASTNIVSSTTGNYAGTVTWTSFSIEL